MFPHNKSRRQPSFPEGDGASLFARCLTDLPILGIEPIFRCAGQSDAVSAIPPTPHSSHRLLVPRAQDRPGPEIDESVCLSNGFQESFQPPNCRSFKGSAYLTPPFFFLLFTLFVLLPANPTPRKLSRESGSVDSPFLMISKNLQQRCSPAYSSSYPPLPDRFPKPE